jgi:dnd system-associated protein 4
MTDELNTTLYRPAKFEKLLKTLGTKSDKTDKSVFKHHKHTLIFAALLGLKLDKRKKLTDSDLMKIEWHTMENNNDSDWVYLVALAAEKNVGVLGKREMVKIFEEYMCGGLEEMQFWLEQNQLDEYGSDTIIKNLKENNILKSSNESVQNKFVI